MPKMSGVLIIVTLLFFWNATAQKEKDTIDTQRVVIVKAYTPTISDAFKVKSNPILEDSLILNKKEIRYSIFSAPVASTFTPEKGRAENIDKPEKISLLDNYATLGFGNYTSVLAEFYTNFQVNRTDNVGLYLHHNSSQGGIEDVQLNDKFYNSFVDVNYTSRTKDFTYTLEAGAEHQLYNWYGLPETPQLSPEQLNEIDPEQVYWGGKLGGKFEFKDVYFKKVTTQYRYFTDAFSSQENHFKITPTMEFEIGDELVTTNVNVDFVKGSFEREQQLGVANDYQILNIGLQPSLLILRDNLTITLGAEIVYSVDSQRDDSDIYFYPNVTASYRLLEDNIIAYGGIEGGLEQNTYRDAVQINPYISPNLEINPTHKQYDAYVGLKGKISDVVSYNVRGSYMSENDKPLFVKNRVNSPILTGFDHGNSFGYRYDDITTLIGYGELNFSINKKFKLGITGEYFSYSTDRQLEPWNLPDLKGSVFMDYQIDEHWFAGAQLFYVGERFDINNTIANSPNVPEATLLLDSFFDANVNVGYRFNERLSVFLKGNNLAGAHYERWANFPVQGVQVLGGVTYKFNWKK